MARLLLYVGLALMVVGVGLFAVPTGSFSSIGGDRPVDISLADDDNAFLGMHETGVEVNHPTKAVRVAEIRNNFDSSLTVSYEASIDSDAVSLEHPSESVTISQGSNQAIRATCAPPNGGSGTATLTVTVHEAEADGTTLSEATLEASVNYDCPGKPSGPPAEGGDLPENSVAFIDSNDNSVYDENEEVLDRSELRSFDDDSANLVVSSGETISYGYQDVEIEAKSVTVYGTELESDSDISISAEDGRIHLEESTVRSNYGEIELEADSVTSTNSEIRTDSAITVTGDSGTVDLTGSTLNSRYGEVEVSAVSVDAENVQIDTESSIEVSTEADLNLDNANINSDYRSIEINGGSVSAAGATVETDEQITITGDSGPVDISQGTISSKSGEITITGGSVTANKASLETESSITVESDAESISMVDASLISDYSNIEVISAADLDASNTVFETDAKVTVSSVGDLLLNSSEIRTDYGEATVALNNGSSTLEVDGALIEDNDNNLVYSPNGVTVNGTPETGQVTPG
ncbi:hypothetical protein [Natrinema sp. H-ect4]|uniref:hypothetical protein n=1 Tax=Natrinema sp. H-ect4 TaxID=3242699 RepID=UPI0035A9A8BF